MYRKQRNWTCYHVIHPPFVFITQNQGHYLYYITVRTGQVYPSPPRPRQECINEFIIQRLNPLVVVDLHSAYVMNSELTPEVVIKFLPAQFSWIWCKCLQNDFIHSKIFQSDRKQRSYDEKFTAHHRSRNADLNLRLVDLNLRLVHWKGRSQNKDLRSHMGIKLGICDSRNKLFNNNKEQNSKHGLFYQTPQITTHLSRMENFYNLL